jgi:tungstate transport system substrate-binding protein
VRLRRDAPRGGVRQARDCWRTNIAEIQLCKDAGIDIAKDKGSRHRESGRGMGAAQNTASALNGYVLLDCGTWLALKKRSW